MVSGLYIFDDIRWISLKVMGIPHALFDEKLEKMKSAKGIKLDTDLTASDLKEVVEEYKSVYVQSRGEKFPSGIYIYVV